MTELAGPLACEGIGARSLRLGLYRVDGRSAFLELGLARPTRDANHVGRLLDLRLERTGEAGAPGFGFEAVRLDATAVEPLTERQASFAASPNHRAGERLAALVDVLRQRLGTQSARRLKPRESHLPERATLAGAVEEEEPAWPLPDGEPTRPALLLRPPEPAEVLAVVPEGPPRRFRWRGETHRVAHAQGPERIAAEWWLRRHPTRDYYVVEDESGRRFWLFREGLYGRETVASSWFAHGLFA
jgi:protein ImuB